MLSYYISLAQTKGSLNAFAGQFMHISGHVDVNLHGSGQSVASPMAPASHILVFGHVGPTRGSGRRRWQPHD